MESIKSLRRKARIWSIASLSLRKRSKTLKKADTYDDEKNQIIARRGAFRNLPVYCANDIVHGSWWYVWGSFIATLIPIIPLADIHSGFFNVTEDTELPVFNDSATWVLLILSGLFYTVGSFAFVRAFRNPPPRPIFKWHHLSTDELLGAWLYFLAAVPAIPYSLVFLDQDPKDETNWGLFLASILFVGVSGGFVYTCYPMQLERFGTMQPVLYPRMCRWLGENHWSLRHVVTDWLAMTWFFFFSTLMWFLGSLFFLCSSRNERQFYIWSTSFIDAFVFLVGSAYFIAGSYPNLDAIEMEVRHNKVLSETVNPVLKDVIDEVKDKSKVMKSDSAPLESVMKSPGQQGDYRNAVDVTAGRDSATDCHLVEEAKGNQSIPLHSSIGAGMDASAQSGDSDMGSHSAAVYPKRAAQNIPSFAYSEVYTRQSSESDLGSELGYGYTSTDHDDDFYREEEQDVDAVGDGLGSRHLYIEDFVFNPLRKLADFVESFTEAQPTKPPQEPQTDDLAHQQPHRTCQRFGLMNADKPQSAEVGDFSLAASDNVHGKESSDSAEAKSSTSANESVPSSASASASASAFPGSLFVTNVDILRSMLNGDSSPKASKPMFSTDYDTVPIEPEAPI
jgi:hypothetical protein